MLYIPKPSQKVLSDYNKSLNESIRNKLADHPLNQDATDYLTEAKIKEILTAEPSRLIAMHDEFMPKLVPDFDLVEYNDFLKNRYSNELAANLVKYKEANKVLKIFNYEEFISKSKSKSYKLALAANRNTCTYCNRLYTNTVQYRDPKTNRYNPKTRITRPQFDHWYAHSIYPLLGLSFYNLIPSCSVCNSSVKGSTPFDLRSHIHPYIYEDGQDFKFSFEKEGIDGFKVKITDANGVKIKKHLEEFKIQQVYNAHAELELKDLIDLRYKYSENYLDTLFNETFSHFSVTRPELYRMIFGVENEKDFFHKRTFSKFKTDIISELLNLDNLGNNT